MRVEEALEGGVVASAKPEGTPDEWVVLAFGADRRLQHVAGQDEGLIG